VKRTLTRVALVLGLTGLAVLAAGAWALRRLDAPELRQDLAARAGAALGTRVRVEALEIGPLSGLRMQGVGVSNPAPFKSDLLTAESVSLRHRVLPLLLGRVVVDRLELLRPVLALVADERGAFNYERLGARGSQASAPASALPLRVVLSSVAIDRGRLSLADATGTRLLGLDDLELRARVDAGPEGLRGEGRLSGALSGGGIGGTLQAQAVLSREAGAGAIPRGQGRADVRGCRVEGSALFAAIAAALALPELARPEMDECRVEFRLGAGRVVMPVVSLKGRPVQVTGTGSIVLASGALDFDMKLALQDALRQRLPAKEIRAAFKDRGDGYAELPFTLRGTTARPQTDLAARVARAAAGEAAKGKLRGILDKVF
jgi:uncharacterized protein involved in outer membrane biogenesis